MTLRFIRSAALALTALSISATAPASGGWYPEFRFHITRKQSGREMLKHPGLVPVEIGGADAAGFYWVLTGLPTRPEWGDDIDYACCEQFDTGKGAENAAKGWLDVRNAFMPEPLTELPTEIWESGAFVARRICYADAFRQAGQTLQRYRGEYPAEHVRDWVRGQDAVFRLCGSQDEPLPPDAAADAPAWLQRDRAYQKAAALFYRGDYAGAVVAFDAIAADRDSPWSGIAPYLAIRALLREHSDGAGALDDEKNAAERAAAAARLLETVSPRAAAILADPARAAWHTPTRRLWRDAQMRGIEWPASFERLAARLRQPASQPDPAADLRNDLALFQTYTGASGDGWLDAAGKPPLRDDLALWAVVMRGAYDDGLYIGETVERRRHLSWVMARWRETQSRPWLIAALWLQPDLDAEPALRRHAEALAGDPADPAYFSVRLFLARDRLRRGDPDGARRWAHPLLAHPAAVDDGDANLLHWLLLPSARTEDEFGRWLMRRAPYTYDPESGEALPPVPDAVMDRDGMDYFNALPLAAQLRVARRGGFEPGYRRQLFGAIWTRAWLLQDWPRAREAARERARDTTASDAAWYARFAAEADPARLHRLGLEGLGAPDVHVEPPLLRPVYGWVPSPFMQDPAGSIDDYADFGTTGKWCSFKHLGRRSGTYGDPVHPMRWLSAAEERQRHEEAEKLAAIPPVSVYYSREILELARLRPDDAAVPDMLATAVRMSRFTCASAEVGRVSRETLRYLKRHYPRSAAANTTKYWYSGKYSSK